MTINKVYKITFLIQGRTRSYIIFDLPNIRGITEIFWKWIRTNTILSCDDVKIWSIEKTGEYLCE